MSTITRAVSTRLWRRPNVRTGLLLGGPLLWLGVAYLGALVVLLINSFYRIDTFTYDVIEDASLLNFRELADRAVYWRVTRRTFGIAAAVTIIDTALALPIAFYLAKVATPRTRRFLSVAFLLPLWAGYLVKAYAWRAVLDPVGGVMARTIGASPGFGVTAVIIVLSYLWLPYAILPVYAGLERLPDSLLEASADLGGRSWRTTRSIVLPLIVPAMAAGTIFTFALSLGDFYVASLVGGKTQMIGNVIFLRFGIPDAPFAAAFCTVPMVIMFVYLFIARRLGAFENL